MAGGQSHAVRCQLLSPNLDSQTWANEAEAHLYTQEREQMRDRQVMHGLAACCLLLDPEQQIHGTQTARAASSPRVNLRVSAGVAMQSAIQAGAPHRELLVTAGVFQDEVVDLLHGMPQLVVGVYWGQLQLCDQPVHLQATKNFLTLSLI